MCACGARSRRSRRAVPSSSPTTRRMANRDMSYFAAEAATPELLAFTVRHTSGYVRVALPGTECDRLNLPPMCHREGDGSSAADRVAVDWCGTGTGISATDRARTIAALAARSRTRPTSGARVTWFRCGPAMTGCWDNRDRPRQRWIWPGWLAGDRRERCARSSPANTPPRWPVAPSWSSSRRNTV